MDFERRVFLRDAFWAIQEAVESKYHRKTVLIGITGSWARGIANENSDIDFKAFVLPTKDELLKGRRMNQRFSTTIAAGGRKVSAEGVVKDIRDLEELLIKQNPDVLSMLDGCLFGVEFKDLLKIYDSEWLRFDPLRSAAGVIGWAASVVGRSEDLSKVKGVLDYCEIVLKSLMEEKRYPKLNDRDGVVIQRLNSEDINKEEVEEQFKNLKEMYEQMKKNADQYPKDDAFIQQWNQAWSRCFWDDFYWEYPDAGIE